jgi:adenylate kinase
LGEVIVVTGTPGTGKTAFSRALAKSIGAGYVNLTQYVSKHKLYSAIDRKRRTKIVNVVRTRTSLGKALAGERGAFVVDSHIPEGIIPKVMVRRVFVLRCHPKVLEARLKAKKWNPNKIRENVLAEIVDSCLTSAVRYYGWRKVIQLDTSSRSMRGCVASAQTSMRRRLTRRARFDWLTKLEKQGLLDRYLK